MRGLVLVGGVGAILLLATASWVVAQAEDRRNPFGVPDVANPDDQQVQDFAKTVKLSGDKEDENAKQWVTEATAGKPGSIDGTWSDRWNGNGGDWQYGTGPTRIKTVGDRVYLLVNASNGQYLIDTKREKNRLVGRYQGVDAPDDTGPCVLLIVDDERIDGNWAGSGRWDFRRKLQPN